MILASIILVLLAIVGAPLFAVIATSAMLGFYREDSDLMNMALEIQGIGDLPFLAAIPLFTFAGYLLSESEAPKRLVRITGAFLGWMPGGLALVSLAACAFFTAFTGASGVTIIALGAILYPALKHDGYPDKFNLGLITSSGSLGLLFAPSLPLILYGVIAEVSIDSLFLAGILPGLVMLSMMVSEVLVGFLLGFGQIAKWIPGETPAEQKAEEVQQKLIKFQTPLGALAIGTAIMALLYQFKIL